MSEFFLSIYERLERHPVVFWITLAVSVAVSACLALKIEFNEDITGFFEGKNETSAVFENLKIKDKIVVAVSGEDPDEMIEAGERFVENLNPAIEEGYIKTITEGVDKSAMDECVDFIYSYLPIFLTDADYDRLAEATEENSIERSVRNAYAMVVSASGVVVGDVVMCDPLNIGSHLLRQFARFDADVQYELYGERIFTRDMSTMMMFIDPVFGMGRTGENKHLVSLLQTAARSASTDKTTITCIGGPVVAVHNARQIKQDTTLTLGIAMAIILVVILFSFRSRWSIPLIVIPPAFGALFALAAVWLIQGSISAIAIGAGAVVLGVALSYSIHFISHINHTNDPRRVITDLASPLTIGCLTTIGAFAALMFTSSALLHDIGLFCVFTLIGTTLFCLIFLPHFIAGIDNSKRSPLLEMIERGNAYSYDSNKWIVLLFGVLTVVCLFFCRDVRFDSDMSNLNYMPRDVAQAEQKISEATGDAAKNIYLVSSADNLTDLTERYRALGAELERFKKEGKIAEYVLLDNFIIAPEVQRERIARWEEFWRSRRKSTIAAVNRYARSTGFREEAFSRFEAMLQSEFAECGYTHGEIGDVPALREWIEVDSISQSFISRVTLDREAKSEVYEAVGRIPGTTVVDRAWFSAIMLENTVNDFNYILFISSLIVFVALLLSYGRAELTLLTFLPMCISWVIILGMMAIFDVRFNVVNIILATFIFGIGDDFSIFIMDGLLSEYKCGERLLSAHKTAIFFSAFTAIVGMGVMIFAKHPALRSIAMISVLGLCVVVLVAYTIQPLLFRLLIGLPTRKGGFPHTFLSLLNSTYCFLFFGAGCVVIRLYIIALALVPIGRQRKKDSVRKVIYRFTKFFLCRMATVRTVCNNPCGERFEKPALIIANHQSFVDILLLLSIVPKVVMVTNRWVWNSPFFGRIIRYADFRTVDEGYDALAEALREQIDRGYSVVVFPEGTRSANCSIQRFHKGAFYLAEKLNLDLLPIVIYGTGMVSSKEQPFQIKSGVIAASIGRRIATADQTFGQSYQERAKACRRWFVKEYAAVCDTYSRASNPYFRNALIKNYIYKGPVLEWYMKVKCRIDGYYALWDRLIPRDASVVDIGCGYGQMSLMLATLAPQRTITGIDYDADKIALARHSFLHSERIRFECADMREAVFPQADVYIFNDSLHYVDEESQYAILTQAVDRMNPNGMIMVRDGDASDVQRHAKIENTEKWSTKIIKFNKTVDRLLFTDSARMKEFAAARKLSLQIRKCDCDSSETLYVFRKILNDGKV